MGLFVGLRKAIFIVLGLIFCCAIVTFLVKTISADGNLLSYWKLDETTAGSTAIDSSGNGYDGTPHNSPVPSTDVPSTITFTDPESLQFNGTQWVSIPDNAAFAMTSATFSVWVKFTDTSKGDMNMIAKRSSDGSQAQWQFGYNGGGNNFKVSLANGTSGNSCCHDFNWSPSPALTQNVWYNIAVTIDGTNHKLIWYRNGVSKLTQDITGYSLGSEIPGTDLTLGASYNGTSELLYGLLDDVRIYSVALSGSDVANIAAGQSGPGVPTPTPTPSPTPTPTSTIAPSNNNSGSPYSSSNIQTTCTNSSPGIPDLFQVSTSPTTATVYFVPVLNSSGYIVSYGLDSHANQYNGSFDQSETTGVVSYTINSLSPNTTYYFRVQAKNGCMTGSWSQTLRGQTTGNEIEMTQAVITQSEVNPTPTSAPKGTISITSKTQTANNPPLEQTQQGYSLAITIKNNGQPVSGATVELHSMPMKTITDKNGVARFTNVEKGNHTVLLAYQGYSGQEKVSVNGDKKDMAINITIQLNLYTNWLFIGGTICLVGFAVIIVFLLVLLKKRRKSDNLSQEKV